MLTTLSEEALLLKDHWGTGNYYDMTCKLSCFTPWANEKNWFSLSDMGAIAATAFNVALVSIGLNNSFTYLPVKDALGYDPAQKLDMIVILHVHKEKHWVEV